VKEGEFLLSDIFEKCNGPEELLTPLTDNNHQNQHVCRKWCFHSFGYQVGLRVDAQVPFVAPHQKDGIQNYK
jgi:hypothetical protein